MWKCWQDLMWIQFVLLLRVGGWGWVVKCIQTSSRLFMTLKCSNMSFIFFKWVLTKTNEFCSIILNKNEEAFSHTILFYFWSLQVFIQNTYLLKHFLKEIYWVLHSKPKVDYIIFTFSLCYNLLLFQQAAMFILLPCDTAFYSHVVGKLLCSFDFYLNLTVIHFLCYCHAQHHIVHFLLLLHIHNYMNSSYWHLNDRQDSSCIHIIVWYLMMQSTCLPNRLGKLSNVLKIQLH